MKAPDLAGDLFQRLRYKELLDVVCFAATRVIVPLTVFAVLLEYVALMTAAVPAADDFCKASLSFMGVPQDSVLAVTSLYYRGWSPRWVTTFIQSSVMSQVDLVPIYSVLLIVVMLSTVTALWLFFRIVLRFRGSTAALLSAGFYVFWASTSPAPQEDLFWLTGAIEYQLPLCSALLVGVCLLGQGGNAPARRSLTAVAALLSFLVPAQHELVGMALWALLVLGAAWNLRQRTESQRWLLCAAAATVSIVVLVLAPGTAVRAAVEHRSLWDFAHILHYVVQVGGLVIKWSGNPIAILLGVWILALDRVNEERRRLFDAIKRPGSAICVYTLALVPSLVLLVEIAAGADLPGRAVGCLQFVFSLALLCLVLLQVPDRAASPAPVVAHTIVSWVLAASLVAEPTVRTVFSDLFGPARPWQAFMGAILRTETSIEGKTLPQRPAMFIGGLSSDPHNWVNRCAANYLRVKVVRVVASGQRSESP